MLVLRSTPMPGKHGTSAQLQQLSQKASSDKTVIRTMLWIGAALFFCVDLLATLLFLRLHFVA